MKLSSTIAIVFMIKPNHNLEWQATLLAASWRYHFGCRVSLHAFIEAHEVEELSEETKQKLNNLQVDLQTIKPDGMFASVYPHGNKILASVQKFDADRVVFCDSDIYIHRGFDLEDLCKGVVSAVPAGMKTWGEREGQSWEYLYRKYLDISVPEQIFLENNEQSSPYYNAGLVSFDNHSNFAKNWLELSQLIDHDNYVTNKRPWLDQIALPLAIKKTTIETQKDFKELSKLYNCTPKYIERGFKTPFIIHYHGMKRIYDSKLNVEISKQLNITNTNKDFYSLNQPIHQIINKK